RRSKTTGTRVSGTVVGYVDEKPSALYPVFRFPWKGETFHVRGPMGSLQPLYPIGRDIPLYVGGETPLRVSVGSGYLTSFGLVLAGLGLVSCTVFFLTVRMNIITIVV